MPPALPQAFKQQDRNKKKEEIERVMKEHGVDDQDPNAKK